MRPVKVIFIVMEVLYLLGVIVLAYSNTSAEDWVKATYISLLALNAVAFQREQQDIDWNEKEDYVRNI